MSSMLALFLALVPAAPVSAAGATGNENPPLFPLPKAELAIEPTEQGPRLLELIQQYAALTDQHFVLTSQVRDQLAQVRVVLDRPVRVPPDAAQSFFEHVLIQNDCLLALLRERAPRLLTVVPMNTYAGRMPALAPAPVYVPIERVEELREHPALYARTVLTTERLDVRQMANAMRTVLSSGSNLGEVLMSMGGSDALLIQGPGARVVDLVSMMRIADEHSPEPIPPAPAPAPVPSAPARAAARPAPRIPDVVQVKGDIQTIDTALQSYAITHGMKYPASIEVLITPDKDGEKWLDMDKVPADPWNRPYVYEPPHEGKAYRIYTLGADGRPGGTGKDRDIDQEMIKSGDV